MVKNKSNNKKLIVLVKYYFSTFSLFIGDYYTSFISDYYSLKLFIVDY